MSRRIALGQIRFGFNDAPNAQTITSPSAQQLANEPLSDYDR